LKLTLRARFTILAFATSVLVAILLIVGVGAYRRLNAGLADLDAGMHVTVLAERLVRSVDSQVKEYGDVANGEDHTAAANLARLDTESRATLKAWQARLASIPADMGREAQVASYREVEAQYAAFRATGDRVVRLAQQGRRSEAFDLIESELDQISAGTLGQNVTVFVTGQESRLAEDVRAVRTEVVRIGFGLGIAMLLLLAVSLIVPVVLGRQVLTPIHDLELAARQIAAGILDATVPVRSSDELGELASTFNGMAAGLRYGQEEMHRANDALRAARDTAESASHAKSEFLANMSHEIRTPLNGLLGMTELALDTELEAETREYLTTAHTSAEGLLEVINDILDFSKIEAGHLELDVRPFDLRGGLERVGKTLALRAHQKSLELACQVHEDVPEQVVGDEARLRQVLVNLIGNAVKFTESGEIVLAADCVSETATHARVKFQVTDTGIGIPSDKQAMIFDSFTQADTSTTRRYGGTGLGLAISSRLVRLMGGRLLVDSAPGRGSTFWFELDLPRASAQPQRLDHEIRAVLAGRPALIVDDNATNRRILEHMLLQWGAEVRDVESGPLALTAMEIAMRNGHPFALVLLDANMPSMDGFALAEEIRRRPRLASPSIMMLSSAHRPGDLARCRELGIALHLTKPIGRADLRAAIVQVLSPSSGVSPASAAAAPSGLALVTGTAGGALPPLHLLVVEDNPVNQRLATLLLEKQGHRVTSVSDGPAALEVLGRETFDVVLMDVQMPEMSGLEVTRRVRAAEKGTGRHVPIVALTARVMSGDRQQCAEAGMDAFLAKPIRRPDLIATLEDIVARFHAVTPAPAASAKRPLAAHARASEAPFDAAEMMERFEGSEDVLNEMFTLFRQDMPGRIAALHAAFAKEDGMALQHAAHSIKGALATLAAHPARDVAAELEEMGEARSLAGVPDAMVRLDRELARLSLALHDFRPPAAAA